MLGAAIQRVPGTVGRPRGDVELAHHGVILVPKDPAWLASKVHRIGAEWDPSSLIMAANAAEFRSLLAAGDAQAVSDRLATYLSFYHKRGRTEGCANKVCQCLPCGASLTPHRTARAPRRCRMEPESSRRCSFRYRSPE